jgi:hypothetical protein
MLAPVPIQKYLKRKIPLPLIIFHFDNYLVQYC